MQAYIGGIVSMSTVDWPKNICTVIFFAGCDFNCPYCQNSEIIKFREESLKDIREIRKEIRKNVDFIDAVLFSGGEASLQKGPLVEIGLFAKKMGLRVGIETNGTKPEVLEYLIDEGILDFVGLDYKAPLGDSVLFEKVTKAKTFFKSAEEVIKSVRRTLEILRDNQDRLDIELRTTIVPRLIFRKQDVLAIAAEIDEMGFDCRWSLQQFRSDFGKVLDPMYKDIDNPRKQFLEGLRDYCISHFPNLRIDVKAV